MSTTVKTRRPRPKLVTLTDAAATRVAEILAERGEGYLRVGVKNGGCAGMEYLMDYVAQPEKFDEVVEDKGVQIVVDAKAVLFLLGSVVDMKSISSHPSSHSKTRTKRMPVAAEKA